MSQEKHKRTSPMLPMAEIDQGEHTDIDVEIGSTNILIEKKASYETLRFRKAVLEVVNGPDQGLRKELTHNHVLVGSSSACDLVLSDSTVSRRHFELSASEKGFVLRDTHSTNGTFIRGLRIGQAILSGGEEIAIGTSRLVFSLLNEHEEVPLSSKPFFGTMLGLSVMMRRVFAILERTARTEVNLLLEGESGTGKDLAAENVHLHSKRKNGPFVVVDCGAVAPTLIESELFGYKRGAFTGAEHDHPGVLESANGGTVFLDEIGTIDLSLQPKLLRLLENRQTRRIGETFYRPVDVRIIAATNSNLAYEVKRGLFREDLYYRLTVVHVQIPPLRDRLEDIPLIAKAFAKKLNPTIDPETFLRDDVLALLANHNWPGNVRELRNVIERILIFPDMPQTAISNTSKPNSFGLGLNDILTKPYRTWREHFEKAYLEAALEAAKGIKAIAAKHTGIPRQTFYRMLEKYDLK